MSPFHGDERALRAPSTSRLPRVERWPLILRAEIAKHQNAPFEWGVSDCAFWADIVLALTGWDPIIDGRGYTDAETARASLEVAGYSTMLELCEDRLVEIPIAHAMRGDLVFPEKISALSSPFVLDGVHAFSKTLAGPVVLNRSECIRAFGY